MSQDYVEKNRGFITSSKLKVFMTCPFQYYLQFEEEKPEPEKEPDYFLEGTCLDDYLSYGPVAWKKKYEILEPKAKRTSYKGEKTPLTHSSGKKVISAIHEAHRQPIFDLGNKEYVAQEVLTAKFKTRCSKVLSLRGTPDRYSVTLKKLRDWKFYAKMKDIEYSPDDIIFQLAFYETLLQLKFKIDFECIVDVLQKDPEFTMTGSFLIPPERILQERSNIKKALNELGECIKNKDFPAVEEDLRNHVCIGQRCKMYSHCTKTAIQRNFISLS